MEVILRVEISSANGLDVFPEVGLVRISFSGIIEGQARIKLIKGNEVAQENLVRSFSGVGFISVGRRRGFAGVNAVQRKRVVFQSGQVHRASKRMVEVSFG